MPNDGRPGDDQHGPDQQARDHVARVEALLSGLESLPDPAARVRAEEAVGALVELYGECLARVMDWISRSGDGSRSGDRGAAEALASDELVGHLLLVHDLHPEPVEERVRRALREARPYLRSHGGDVELLEVRGPVARVRLRGSCQGCPSSSATLELAVRDAVAWTAPEIERVEAEGALPSQEALIPVDDLFRDRSPAGSGAAPEEVR